MQRIDHSTPSFIPRWSSPTLKAVMAVSGAVWLGFLVAHLGTNIRVFGGPASINDYYAGLKSNAVVLWGVRAVLALSILAHAAAAIILTQRSRAARPLGYAKHTSISSTFASRSMKWSGPLLGVFILYHLLHLTGGQAMPLGTTFVDEDQYGNIVTSFSVVPVAAVYIVSLLLLSVHLWHGSRAAFLSMGLSHPRHTRTVERTAFLIVALLVGGMLLIPIGVLLGWA